MDNQKDNSKEVAQYRKKAVIIHAVQLLDTPASILAVNQFIEGKADIHHNTNMQARDRWDDYVYSASNQGGIYLKTLESDGQTQKANFGDYIIKGIKGEFYPCKPDVFALTYEPTQPSIPVSDEKENEITNSPEWIAGAAFLETCMVTDEDERFLRFHDFIAGWSACKRQTVLPVSDVDKLAEEKYPHIKKSSVEYKRVSELEAYLTVFLSQNDAEYASFEQSFRAAAYVGANWQRDAVATNYEKIIGLIKGRMAELNKQHLNTNAFSIFEYWGRSEELTNLLKKFEGLKA